MSPAGTLEEDGPVVRRRKPSGMRAHRMLIGGFAACIAVGTVLLMLPAARAQPVAGGEAESLTWTEALFTSTSAVCVTGLTVVDTGSYLSPFGQLVVLILFQLGGLGIMTVSTLLLIMSGSRPSLAAMAATGEALGTSRASEVLGMLRSVILFTVAVEAVGAVLLAAFFTIECPADRAAAPCAWSGLFHAVSAFCNAGFGLHADSLEGYRGAWGVNVVVMALIVTGGIGFPVLRDLRRIFLARQGADSRPTLSLHSKIVLVATAALLVAGTLAFAATEWHGRLAGLPLGERVLASMFQSTAARTAGFSTVGVGQLAPATLFLVMVLMFVGASPCSTAGGIKTSTVGVLGALVFSKLRGREEPCAFGRSIHPQSVARATTVALLAGLVVLAFTWLMLVADGGRFGLREVMFEVVSAFGTVGLSTGITADLGTASRLMLVALMFIGRLGPLTVVLSVSRMDQPDRVQYPSETLLIG